MRLAKSEMFGLPFIFGAPLHRSSYFNWSLDRLALKNAIDFGEVSVNTDRQIESHWPLYPRFLNNMRSVVSNIKRSKLS